MKVEKFYRVETQGRILSQVAMELCLDDDCRKNLKPHDARGPLCEVKSSEGLVFWTQSGFETYLKSGLFNWHSMFVSTPIEFLVISSGKDSERHSFEDFIKSESFILKEKVVIYVLKNREILVFEHDKEWSEAGIQVPAGGINAGEDAQTAAKRELKEEAGLCLNQNFQLIESYILFRSHHNEFNRRHVFQVNLNDNCSDKWTHKVKGTGMDQGYSFHFYWMNLDEAKFKLSGELGRSLFSPNVSF